MQNYNFLEVRITVLDHLCVCSFVDFDYFLISFCAYHTCQIWKNQKFQDVGSKLAAV